MSKLFLSLFSFVAALVPMLVPAQEAAAPAPTLVDQRLSDMEKEFLSTYDAQVGLPFNFKVADLNAKYATALDRALDAAIKSGKLDAVLTFRDEKKQIADGGKVPSADAPDAPDSLKKMRATYRSELGKLEADRDLAGAPLLARFDASLNAYQTLLTKERQLDEAIKVRAARQSLGGVVRKEQPEPAVVATTEEAPPETHDAVAGSWTIPVSDEAYESIKPGPAIPKFYVVESDQSFGKLTLSFADVRLKKLGLIIEKASLVFWTTDAEVAATNEDITVTYKGKTVGKIRGAKSNMRVEIPLQRTAIQFGDLPIELLIECGNNGVLIFGKESEHPPELIVVPG